MIPTVNANGAVIPVIGLGTWPMKGEDCARAVAHALSVGYRHIDTAAAYENEDGVGEGLRASGLKDEDVFVTTKVWFTNLADGAFQRSVEGSLKKLARPYADLVLIHWPSQDVPLRETLKALAEVKRRGLARHVGVANFTSALLREAVALCEEPLVANQCEYHPTLAQDAVLAATREAGMAFTSYTPLGRGAELAAPEIVALAGQYGKTPAQIVLRWHVQQPGVVAVPKSGTPKRIEENIDIFDFALTEAEMVTLSGLARPDGRVVDPAQSPQWDAPRA